MKTKRLLSLLMCAAMGATLLTGCGGQTGNAQTPAQNGQTAQQTEAQDDLSYLKSKGNMVIGYTVYEPMNYTDEQGNFTGFDTELATAVCEQLGLTPEFQLINWDTKEVELAGKTIDAIWNGMTLTPEREANMACTNPYVKNAQVVVVKQGTEYTDTTSLIGKTVCAEIGSAGEAQIKGSEDTEADEGLTQTIYVGKAVQTDCLTEVKAGTADAAVLDLTLAKAMTGEGTDFADLTIVDELAVENYGVAFRQDSNVRDAVNEVFDAMKADGSMQAIADKYSLVLAE